MLNSAILMITILLTLLFFVVGGIVGWLANQHLLENKPPYLHPEMFDKNGNILPDEIVAVSFSPDYFDDDECEDEDDDDDD